MRTRHIAYGLDLDTSFALPGMTSARADGSADGLPALALERLTPAELDPRWRGQDGRIAWSGTLGDGCKLTIELGRAGDVRFIYGKRARFRLAASGERLECAPAEAGLHWQQALLGRILPNVAIMRGYEALHASALESPQGVVAVAAPSGMGKTTLALELMRRGWPLFADDVLTLGAGAGAVRAYPGAPHMNVADGPHGLSGSEPIGETLGILAGERWIAVGSVATEPRPVRMVCLFERGPELDLEARVLPPTPLALAPYMLGLAGDRARERQRFARYADLMASALLVRLTCTSNDRPSAVADLIEETLAESGALAVGGTR